MATTLAPGDIAIIGVNSDNPDDFSFVLLTDITAGTEIFFTDSGILSDGSFRANEGAVRYTAPADLAAGSVISFVGNAADFTATNDSNVGNNGFSLSTSGDQVIAFQGSTASPIFLYAVQTNSTQFQTTADSSNTSALPTGLVVSTTAVAVGTGSGAGDEADNATYNESVTSGTQAELLAAISDAANWNGNNTRINDLADGPFTVSGGGASQVLIETFDDASQFSTSEPFFSDGFGDYFGISDGAGGGDFGGDPQPNSIKAYSGFDSSFLTGQDLDGEGATLPITVTWSGLDISGLSNLEFSGDFAEFFDAPGDIDANDFIRLTYQIDGGGFQNLLWFSGADFTSTNGVSNGVFREDTNFDGIGDGAALGNAAQTFTAAIAGTGSTLNLQLSVSLDAGDEDFGIDNFLIAEASGTGTNLSIAPDNAIQAEGNAGITDFTFTVTRSGDTSGPTDVDFAVTGDADAADFGGILPSGTVSFVAGETTKTITVGVSGDVDAEADETFTVTLANATGGASIVAATAEGTIQNDDAAPLTPIFDIQGDGDDFTSPEYISLLDGQQVTTQGVVTAIASNGFYIQDAVGDGNDDTSDGIFIFTDDSSISITTPNVGDLVEVSGTVDEFFQATQIDSVTGLSTISSNNTIAPIVLGTDRIAPTEIVDDAGSTDYDVTRDGRDFYESIEGMLVTLPDAVAVSLTRTFAGGSVGEFYAIANQGAGSTGANARGGITIAEDTSANNPIGADLNPERIQIDTDLATNSFPTVEVGDLFGDITGVINYAFDDYAISPINPVAATTPSSLTPETTDLVGTDTQLTVASFNVLNLDPGDSNEKFAALGSQIANNLAAPDIIGLQEIQDNNGPTNDSVTAADVTLQALVDAIAAAGGPTYEFIDNTFITDDASGGQPGANIRTAFLYNPDRVSVDPTSIQTISDQNPGSPFNGARLPLVADFTFNGEEVTVITNHFSSKGGSDPLFGEDQPPANGSLDERDAQAIAVNDFVSAELASNPDANIVALGDFNEFQFFSPLETLEQNLTNLTETLPATDRYTFNFEGNSQAIDHILVTGDLAHNAEYDAVHVNTEFADAPSDHDPVVARLTLGDTLSEDAFFFSPDADTPIGNAEDIVLFNGEGGFSTFFDGSDVGLGDVDIDAFDIISDDTILMSFDNAVTIEGLGLVDDSDIVRFTADSLGPDSTAGTFELEFDGSDVGLTRNEEDIDALTRMEDGSLLISTQGTPSVEGVVGPRDEDLLRFDPTTLGADTSGSFSLYFDGSDVRLNKNGEDVDAVSMRQGELLLSTTGAFNVKGLFGRDEDISSFTPTSLGADTDGDFGAELFFDGSDFNITSDISAIDWSIG